MGYLFAYQEKTGMGIKEIMETPWLMIVLGMLTAPSYDWDAKEGDDTIITPKTQSEELNALQTLLM